MKRLIDWHLEQWKTQSHRKPLLLRGARQVGKTFALRNLGKSFKNFVEVNFEYLKSAKKIFEKDLKPERIIQELNILLAGNGLLLGAESNPEWFKIIFLDAALCQAILGLDLGTWFLDPNAEFVNRGPIVEAFVGQELLCYSSPYRKGDLYYWKRAEKHTKAEVDYLYDHKGKILPLEVKSGDGRTLKSLHLFMQTHQQSPYGIRFSAQNYSRFDHVVSQPLYDIFSLAHEDQKESLLCLLNNK